MSFVNDTWKTTVGGILITIAFIAQMSATSWPRFADVIEPICSTHFSETCARGPTEWLYHYFIPRLKGCNQARNQLGTPGVTKSFLRGAQIF